MSANPARPVTLLIGALGGEGGGVLTSWVVAAATAEDFPVQSTSIPGVAQRTGATTYYVEVCPVKAADLGGAWPVMALYPGPGNLDVVVASELLEAGRALELGFVSPDRTTLVASTHRIYAVAEKAQMGDGTYDASRIVEAATTLARRPILADFARAASERGVSINALLLGIIAGSGALPMSRGAFERAIRDGGIAVEANLAGFRAGVELVADTGAIGPVPESGTGPSPLVSEVPAELRADLARFPDALYDILIPALERVVDFQDIGYGRTFLERLAPVLEVDRAATHRRSESGGESGSESRSESGGESGGGLELTREAARYLALWMSYEDVARVADLKSRSSRMAHVRETVGAAADQPVRVTEYFKPGLEEICAVLPAGVARFARATFSSRAGAPRHLPMRVRTDTVLGYLQLRFVAGFKRWRRRSERFAEEQTLIGAWRDAVLAAAEVDYRLALEVVECANLNKGYGDTFERGRGNYLRVMDTVIGPALEGGAGEGAAARVRAAREAALADPEGVKLGQILVAPPVLPVS